MNFNDLKSIVSEEELHIINKLSQEYLNNLVKRGRKSTTINDLIPSLNNMDFQYNNYKLTLPSNNVDSILLKINNDSVTPFICLKNKLQTYYINLYVNLNDIRDTIFLYYSKKEMDEPFSRSYIQYNFKTGKSYHEQIYSDNLLKSRSINNNNESIFLSYLLENLDKKASDIIDLFEVTHDFNIKNDLLLYDMLLFFSETSNRTQKQKIKI